MVRTPDVQPLLTRVVAGVVTICLLGFGAFACTTSPVPCPLIGGEISVYEWRTSAWGTPAAAEDMIRSAEELCLTTIYVDLTGLAVDDLHADLESALSLLLTIAEESPVEIGALAGDPWWGSEAGVADASLVLERIAAVNTTVAAPVRSIHFDVEPWGLDEWTATTASLLTDYIHFVDAIAAEAATYERPLELSFLVPFWFDGTSDEVPQIEIDGALDHPFQHLQRTSASWIVMAYRDRVTGANGVIDLVTQERAVSNAVGLAVETAPVEPLSITFADESMEALDQALRELVAADLGFTEIVINDLEYLRLLASAPSRDGQSS